MIIECSKFYAWLKVPFIINNKVPFTINIDEVHAISFRYYPFDEEIFIKRAYLDIRGDVINEEEIFEKNVSFEIILEDLFQIKRKRSGLKH
jgi:hypothetical protein